MEKKTYSVEVIAIVLHAVISLCILGGYIYTVAIGHTDETLKTLLIMIGGFWFGVLGKTMTTKPTPADTTTSTTSVISTTTVPVNPPIPPVPPGGGGTV